MTEHKAYRLPTNVTPERYEIRLTPDLAAAAFAGEEKISVHVREPVRQMRFWILRTNKRRSIFLKRSILAAGKCKYRSPVF